jgi:hypothetical protein
MFILIVFHTRFVLKISAKIDSKNKEEKEKRTLKRFGDQFQVPEQVFCIHFSAKKL